MKKTKRKRAHEGASAKRKGGWQIVLLDGASLRRKAEAECRKSMTRLEKAKAQWQRFLDEDKAAFDRWMAATFGALLTRLRDVEAAIREREALVREVDAEMFFGGARNARAAYANVQKRRNRAEPAAPPKEETNSRRDPRPETEGAGDTADESEELSDFEQELLFREFVSVFTGMNPDRIDDRTYERMFADFRRNVLGQDRPEPAPQGTRSEAMGMPPEGMGMAADALAEPSRLKELYRVLVRRLHPDLRADSEAKVSAIWHEVQEAYQDGNIERLETLLAMTDIEAKTTGEHTSLGQIRSALVEIRRALRALERNLREARKNLAWNFCEIKERSALEDSIRVELEADVRWNEGHLAMLDEKISRWSSPPAARKAQRVAKQRGQDEFRF